MNIPAMLTHEIGSFLSNCSEINIAMIILVNEIIDKTMLVIIAIISSFKMEYPIQIPIALNCYGLLSIYSYQELQAYLLFALS